MMISLQLLQKTLFGNFFLSLILALFLFVPVFFLPSLLDADPPLAVGCIVLCLSSRVCIVVKLSCILFFFFFFFSGLQDLQNTSH